VIYLDSSVALAHLLVETRSPGAGFWHQRMTSSRLLAYEIWNAIHVRGLGETHGTQARALLSQVAMIGLESIVLMRAMEPFPVGVRTLDGLHLATIEYLRAQRRDVELATYDRRLAAGAQALGIPLFPL
jgi:predicted nucleic acid-binding protein